MGKENKMEIERRKRKGAEGEWKRTKCEEKTEKRRRRGKEEEGRMRKRGSVKRGQVRIMRKGRGKGRTKEK